MNQNDKLRLKDYQDDMLDCLGIKKCTSCGIVSGLNKCQHCGGGN